jgi:DNA-binding transcriptional MerR regulator
MPNPQEIIDELITTSTVAHILNRADNTVRLMEKRGDIRPVARTPTGVRLYSRAEIERVRERLRSNPR